MRSLSCLALCALLAGCPRTHISFGGPTIKSSRGHRIASVFLVGMGALCVYLGATGNIYEEDPEAENSTAERVGVTAVGVLLGALGIHYWMKANRIEEANDRARAATAAPDDLDATVVAAGLAPIEPRLRACGSGTATLRVAVGSDGIPVAITITSSSSPELGACIDAAVRSARFARGGTFTAPFTLP